MTQPTGTPDWVELTRDSSLGRIRQPVRYGGRGGHTADVVSHVIELATYRPALGWSIAILESAAGDLAASSDDAATLVWGVDSAARVGACYQGRAALSPAGRLTGRWEMASVLLCADWLLLPAHRPDPCRVMLPRSAVTIEPVDGGMAQLAPCTVSVSDVLIDPRWVLEGAHALSTAGAVTAAVVGAADGVLGKHIEVLRSRMSSGSGGAAIADQVAVALASAASDIDAAQLQVRAQVVSKGESAEVITLCRQAIARARTAADALLTSGRHALTGAHPVVAYWTDMHAVRRLAEGTLTGLAG